MNLRKLVKETNLTNFENQLRLFGKIIFIGWKSEKRNIIEANRLSFVIRAIDKDLTVLLVGRFIITQINKLRRNDLFEGFDEIDLNKKEKYIYFKMDKV